MARLDHLQDNLTNELLQHESQLKPLSSYLGPLERRRKLAIIATTLLALTFYGVGYWISPERPVDSPDHPKLGWWGWFDQGEYHRSLVALEQDNYHASEHHYPIGYPLVGTLFYPISPNHPFFIPNLICFIVVCVVFLRICQEFVSPEEALLLCFFAVIWPNTIRDNFVRPWTNTPVHAVLLILSWLALAGRRDRFAALLTGACAAVVFMMHPGDLLYAWPVMTALWFGWLGWRDALQRLIWFIAGAAPLLAITLYFSFAIHGHLVSDAYSQASFLVGFSFASFGVKLYTFLIDGFPLFGESRTLVKVYPIILFALPGVILFITRFKWRAAVVVATQVGAIVYFLAYNDFWISQAFKYDSMRYWLWLIPFCALYAYLSIRFAWQELGWIKTAALLLIPILLWTLPNMDIRPVKSQLAMSAASQPPSPDTTPKDQIPFPWACAPAPDGSCEISINLAQPADFDILKLRGIPQVKVIYVTVFVDGRKSLHFHDLFTSDAPDGETYLIFYRSKHGKSIRVIIPRADGNNQLSISSFGLARRHIGLALRNPFKRFHSDGP